jgi:hypothetical protein
MNYLHEMNNSKLKHKFQNEIKIWYEQNYKDGGDNKEPSDEVS